MKLSKYLKLKKILEIQPFQSSFSTLKEVLYYFSFAIASYPLRKAMTTLI
jgi:hypothetical protein